MFSGAASVVKGLSTYVDNLVFFTIANNIDD